MTRYSPLWLQQQTYAASVDRRLPGALWPTAATTGCAVTVSSGMTVNVAAGTVAVPTANNTGTVLCASDAVEPVTLAAAPAAGTNRYDLVICQARGNDLDGGANNDFLFTTVTGTAAASPTIPAVPNNAVALAQIYVPGGSASVTSGNITDIRPSMLAVASQAVLGYNEITAVSGSVGTTETSLGAGGIVTVTLAAARRLLLTAGTRGLNGSASNIAGFFRIKEGATTRAELQCPIGAANAGNGGTIARYLLATAGTHTYNLAIAASSGTVTNSADPTYPTFLLVEDMGLIT
jgi:hypothetical protein